MTPTEHEAFAMALRSAMTANRALLDFIDKLLGANGPAAPLEALQRAVAETRNAEAAWELYGRLSEPATGGRVNLQ